MAWADPRVHNDFKVRCTGMTERGDVASGEVRRRHLVIQTGGKSLSPQSVPTIPYHTLHQLSPAYPSHLLSCYSTPYSLRPRWTGLHPDFGRSQAYLNLRASALAFLSACNNHPQIFTGFFSDVTNLSKMAPSHFLILSPGLFLFTKLTPPVIMTHPYSFLFFFFLRVGNLSFSFLPVSSVLTQALGKYLLSEQSSFIPISQQFLLPTRHFVGGGKKMKMVPVLEYLTKLPIKCLHEFKLRAHGVGDGFGVLEITQSQSFLGLNEGLEVKL